MIKSFLQRVRQFRRPALLSPIFMIMEIMAEVSIPYVMSMLIDNGIEKSDLKAITFYGLVLLCAAIFALAGGTLSGIFAAKAASGFGMNLRSDMFENIQGFSFSNIDKFSSSSLITRLTTDVTNVQNAFQSIIRQAVRGVVMVISSLVMVFRINPYMASIYLVIVPVLGLGLFLIILNVHPIFVRGFKVYDKLNGTVSENLHAIRVVKSFVRKDTEIEKFDKVSTQIYDDFSKAQKRVALNPPLIQFCVYASIILLSWIGAKLVTAKSMTTGELMSFFTYTMLLLMSLTLMSLVFVMVIIARSSAGRIIEVLNEKSDITNPENPLYTVKDGSVTFKNVGFSYVNDSQRLCLSDVDIEIRSGEMVGIIGGTGSSKSTLVQLIPRLYDATVGNVYVGGENVRDYDIKSLRDSVAVVLQKNTLFSGTIRENLLWGNENATDEQIRFASKLAQADDFIESFPHGYDTHVEQGGTNLSGGQRQRLTIARALLKSPKVLILDDSTSAVDTKTDALLQKAFKESLSGTTKLIIAQRIASIMDADKIIVMDGGKIHGVGTHAELLDSNHIYKEVYNTQFSGGGDFDEAD